MSILDAELASIKTNIATYIPSAINRYFIQARSEYCLQEILHTLFPPQTPARIIDCFDSLRANY